MLNNCFNDNHWLYIIKFYKLELYNSRNYCFANAFWQENTYWPKQIKLYIWRTSKIKRKILGKMKFHLGQPKANFYKFRLFINLFTLHSVSSYLVALEIWELCRHRIKLDFEFAYARILTIMLMALNIHIDGHPKCLYLSR